jgi:hypothetical protein
VPTDLQIYELTFLTSDQTAVGAQVWEGGEFCCDVHGWPTGEVLAQEGDVMTFVLVDAFGSPVDSMDWVVPASEAPFVPGLISALVTLAIVVKIRRRRAT